MEECIICFEERDDFKFYSCSHKVCVECYHKINKCPLCQANKIEIVIVTPIQREHNSPVLFVTYILIRCIIICLFISVIGVYLYKK